MAARTGLSTTTCWRRIQQLEQSGVIRGRVALLDRSALGLDVTIFAHVKLSTQGRALALVLIAAALAGCQSADKAPEKRNLDAAQIQKERDALLGMAKTGLDQLYA